MTGDILSGCMPGEDDPIGLRAVESIDKVHAHLRAPAAANAPGRYPQPDPEDYIEYWGGW